MRTTSALSSLLSGACAQYISWGFSSPFFTLRNSCWPDALYSENGRKPWKHTHQSLSPENTPVSLWALKTHHQSLCPENTPSVSKPWKHTRESLSPENTPSVSMPWKHTISLYALKTLLSVSKPWKHSCQSLSLENTPISLMTKSFSP